MKPLVAHPLARLACTCVRPGWVPAALALQPLLVVAGLAIAERKAAIDAIVGVASMFGLALWMAPLCSLILAQRHYRELRLPAPPAAARRGLWSLLLGVNFLGPALAIALAAPDKASAGVGMAMLASAQMFMPTFMLLPTWMLPLVILAAGMTSGLWWPLLDVHAAGGVLPPATAFGLLALTLTLVLAWRARSFVRGGPRLPALSCPLDIALAAGARGVSALDAARSAPWPSWLMPDTRGRADDPPARRIAQLLGPPFTPGSTRRQMAFVAGMCALTAAVVFAAARGAPQAAAIAGVVIAGVLLPTLCAAALFGFDAAFSQRLAVLFRPDRPELTELALMPGPGGPAQRRHALARALAWRPLRAHAVFVIAAMLPLAWLGSAHWPLPLGGLAGPALVWLDAAQYMRRGRGLLPNAGATLVAHVAAAVAAVGLLHAAGDGPARWAVLLVLAAAMVFAARHLHAAVVGRRGSRP